MPPKSWLIVINCLLLIVEYKVIVLLAVIPTQHSVIIKHIATLQLEKVVVYNNIVKKKAAQKRS